MSKEHKKNQETFPQLFYNTRQRDFFFLLVKVYSSFYQTKSNCSVLLILVSDVFKFELPKSSLLSFI